MYKIKPLSNIKKNITIPPDKSISHRAIILSSLSNGKTSIFPFINSDDALATLGCMEKLGVKAKLKKSELTIYGAGVHFNPARKKNPIILFAGNSGTTMRVLCGVLACQRFPVNFKASAQLSARPMARIINPLSKMGADISGISKTNKSNTKKDVYPPLIIKPVSGIKSGKFKLEVASAQVKSAIMLASLYAEGKTTITEPFKSRDHTERMFKFFGVGVKVRNNTVICSQAKRLVSPGKIFVPGDFSSAAFFIVLGLLSKNSKIIIKNVNINPTRCGLLNVLKRMGADIKLLNKRNMYEPYADIEVRSSALKATVVEASEVPSMIDEIPILCVAASLAKGRTEIKGVKELKVKETDRVASIINNLSLAGVSVREELCGKDCKIVINGGGNYHAGNKFRSYSDHRTAMSMIVFASVLNGISTVDDVVCINKSFPQFISLIKSLGK